MPSGPRGQLLMVPCFEFLRFQPKTSLQKRPPCVCRAQGCELDPAPPEAERQAGPKMQRRTVKASSRRSLACLPCPVHLGLWADEQTSAHDRRAATGRKGKLWSGLFLPPDRSRFAKCVGADGQPAGARFTLVSRVGTPRDTAANTQGLIRAIRVALCPPADQGQTCCSRALHVPTALGSRTQAGSSPPPRQPPCLSPWEEPAGWRAVSSWTRSRRRRREEPGLDWKPESTRPGTLRTTSSPHLTQVCCEAAGRWAGGGGAAYVQLELQPPPSPWKCVSTQCPRAPSPNPVVCACGHTVPRSPRGAGVRNQSRPCVHTQSSSRCCGDDSERRARSAGSRARGALSSSCRWAGPPRPREPPSPRRPDPSLSLTEGAPARRRSQTAPSRVPPPPGPSRHRFVDGTVTTEAGSRRGPRHLRDPGGQIRNDLRRYNNKMQIITSHSVYGQEPFSASLNAYFIRHAGETERVLKM